MSILEENAVKQTQKDVIGPSKEFLLNIFNPFRHWTEPVVEKIWDAILAPPPRCPIVLDLDGDGIETTNLINGTYFDHDKNGFLERSGWVIPDDGLLVWDKNNDGIINDGSELINTTMPDGSSADNGFEVLRSFDINNDGKIDSNDTMWNQLKVWQDLNGDGYADTDELFTLDELAIQSINTSYTISYFIDANGNEHRQVGSFTWNNGSISTATDVWFNVDTVDTIPNVWLSEPDDIKALPNLIGFGNLAPLSQAMVIDTTGNLKMLVEQFVAETDDKMILESGGATATQLAEANSRKIIFEQILLTWTLVGGIEHSIGGGFFDPLKLAFIEKITGSNAVLAVESNPNAVPYLNEVYNDLFNMFYSEMMIQTHLKSVYDMILCSWDENTQSAKGDLGSLTTYFQQLISEDPIKGKLVFAEFVQFLGWFKNIFDWNYESFCNNILSWADDETSFILFSFGKDIIAGISYSETLRGTSFNDAIYGGAGNDSLLGIIGDDVLYGGTGNDTLDGGTGSDTYVFRVGSGQDIISQFDPSADRIDTVQFADITSTSLTAVQRSGNDLILEYGTSDSITIKDHFYSCVYGIDQFKFSDGVTLTTAQLLGINPVTMNQTDGDDNIVLIDATSYIIFAAGGNDTVDGSHGNGSSGNNRIYGEAGNDSLIGGTGNDSLYGGTDSDYLDGGVSNDLLDGGTGDDSLVGGDGNDLLDGGTGNDNLVGGAGDDFLDGGTGNDTLNGGLGNDAYLFRFGSGHDVISQFDPSADRIDTVQFADITSTSLTAVQRSGNDLILEYGTSNSVTIKDSFYSSVYGVDQFKFSDSITYTQAELLAAYPVTMNLTDGDDNVALIDATSYIIYARAGNDSLTGGTGSDSLYGGADNDYLSGAVGNDLLDGGDGNDTLYGGAGNDALYGGAGNDVLTFDVNGSAGNGDIRGYGDDTLDGGAGNDTLNGGFDSDTYIFRVGSGQDVISQNDYSSPRIDTVQFIDVTSTGLTAVKRSGYDLILEYGTSDSITIQDYFYASAYAVDQFKFSDGVTFTSAELFAAYPDNHAPSVVNPITNQSTLEDAAFSFTVPATTFNDIDEGDVLTYSASGMPGWMSFDTNTRIFSGTPLNGDVDTVTVTVTATDTSNASVSSTFDVTVNNVNDAPVVANPIANQSTLEDATFSFTVPVNTFADVDLGDTLTYSATLANGSALPSWLSFNATTRTFSGTPTNDNVGTLQLKVTATDTAGASVSDEFNVTVNNVNDAPVVVSPITNQVSMEDVAFSFTVPVNTFADIDVGDTLTYSATQANGSALPSWLTFNAATRTFSGTPVGIGPISIKVTATDSSSTSVSSTFSLDVQTNVITGTANNDNLVGTIHNNMMYGLAGNDTLTGGAGNDTLDGGAGADSLVGGTGDDVYIVDNTSDKAVESTTTNEGFDTVQSSVTYTLGTYVEKLTLTGTSAINGTGNTLDNYLTGNSAINTLTGNAGNDTLDGGAGADSLVGGAGNDIYIVDNTGDKVTESLSAGTDTVLSSVTLTLASNVEYLTLTGTSAINGTGNTLANRITGNSANNTLSGGTGADTMIGGAGDDTYIVDNTGDIITENVGEGTDTVQSSVTYTLATNLEKLTLTGTSAINGTGNTLDNYLTGKVLLIHLPAEMAMIH